MSPKTNAEWEIELHRRLEIARRALADATTDAQRDQARERYVNLLAQLSRLVLDGTLPEVGSGD